MEQIVKYTVPVARPQPQLRPIARILSRIQDPWRRFVSLRPNSLGSSLIGNIRILSSENGGAETVSSREHGTWQTL